MSTYKELENLMKAFASATRLEIIDYVQRGIVNTNEIAQKMSLHRSTIESHLKILIEANVLKKIQIKTTKGILTNTYVLQKNANILMATIKHLSKE
ncbi:MAG TPA: ArsR family transcriptional regulator [Candidatus Bathyarchaeia archaeon]|nr:ArsR family transcriptional regulator [Candidatus Bathyarchaeia archaeon]